MGNNVPGFQIKDLGDNVPTTTDYYYTYTWSIPTIIGLNGQLPPLVLLKDATTPTFTANRESFVASSLEYKFAKSVVWEDIKLTWYDSVGLINIISEWRRSVWTANEGLKPASSYKKNTTLECVLPTAGKPYAWNLIGSWPSQIRSGDLTYTNSDVKLVEVTVTYDWAEELINGADQVGSSQFQNGVQQFPLL